MRFANGAALAILFVTSEFWINTVADEHRRGVVMGLYAAVLSIGFAAGPALLLLTGTEGVFPFAAGAAIMLIGLLPVFLGSVAAPVLDRPDREFTAFLFTAPLVILAAFVFGAVEAAGMSFLPLLGSRLGLAETDAALLVTLVALGNIALQVPIGLAADRVDRRVVLLGCALAGIAGSILLPLIGSSLWLAALILLPWGGAVSGLYTVGLTHLGSHFSGASLAGANATFVMFYSLGIAVGPAATGIAMDFLPILGLPLALAVLFLIYVAVASVRLLQGTARQWVS